MKVRLCLKIKVFLTLFLISQMSVVVQMSELSEHECINYKEKYLKNNIDISELQTKNSRLENEIYYLRKENAKLLAERENCTLIGDNVNSITSSLSNIKENLAPLNTLFKVKYTSNNNQTEKDKLLIENSVKTDQLLNELEKQLTSAAVQFSDISEWVNASLTEFQIKKQKFENHEISHESIEKPTVIKNCAEAADNEVCVIQTLLKFKILSFPVFRESNNWIVILRRVDGTVNFQRSWNEYKDGFGDLKANYFMGLEKIHQITAFQCYELKVVLEDFDNNQAYAIYDRFAIGGEGEDYALNTLGRYSGTAGDGLTYHKGHKWTSIDKDNFKWFEGNRAKRYKGGWWHDIHVKSKLTGLYNPDGNDPHEHGLQWEPWRAKYSFKSAKMLIRQNACS